MKYRYLVGFSFLLVVGCTDKSARVTIEQSLVIQKLFESTPRNPDVMEKWARSCALCHVNGEGGAPAMGDKETWGPRLAKGEVELYLNTLEGFNRMPPLGYCMDCEATDFIAMINLMSGEE
jgi:cytochrome c5